MRYLLLLVLFFVEWSCITPDEAPAPLPLIFPDTAWATATPAETGLDSTRLRVALDTIRAYCGADGLSQLAIVKNGYLVYAGDSIGKAHNIYSCTKSFTTTALGLLIADGRATLDTKAASVEPLLVADYPGVTLRHLATMTSGYSAAGDSRWSEPSADWSWTPYVPITPLFAPGSAYMYWDEAMMLHGRVLTRLAGRDLHAYLDERVMAPIGVGDWDWWADTTVIGLPQRNGCTGISLNAAQLARVGWLYANEGRWKDRQLIPADWVRAATRPQVPAALPPGPADRADVRGSGAYGYGWWTRGTPDADRALPDAPPGTAYMSGFNHNVCFVVPAERLVVVRLGEDGNPAAGKHRAWNAFFRELLSPDS